MLCNVLEGHIYKCNRCKHANGFMVGTGESNRKESSEMKLCTDLLCYGKGCLFSPIQQLDVLSLGWERRLFASNLPVFVPV